MRGINGAVRSLDQARWWKFKDRITPEKPADDWHPAASRVHCLLPYGSASFRYGRASTLTKNLKLPVCWIPSRKRTLIEAPLASGVPSVIVPAESVELKPPPFGCDGGCSSVVPCTLTVHGVVAEPVDARHVAGSLIPLTTTSVEVRGRKSAMPDGAGNVVMSMIRNRSRVTWTSGVVSESAPEIERAESRVVCRIGGEVAHPVWREWLAHTVESRNKPVTVPLRLIGEARFSGPGAPSR